MSPESSKEQTSTQEQRELHHFLDLGEVTHNIKQALEESQRLLERIDRVEAPEGWSILVTQMSTSIPLIVEKFVPPTEDQHHGYFSQHFPEKIEEIPGISFLEYGAAIFVGKHIEYDRNASGYYIYHSSGESRVLHRIDGGSSVQMSPSDILEHMHYTPK